LTEQTVSHADETPLTRPTTGRRTSNPDGWRLLVIINIVGLLLFATSFRVIALGNIPGINGDEAWYGVQALQWLEGGEARLTTPTGNPVNPLLFGPTLLLHLIFPASFTLLRVVAVLSGLTALVVNWLLARWLFDRRVALATTVLLAVLPINIAYSRFAWDASQTVLATLPVWYFSLAAVARSKRTILYLAFAAVGLGGAVLVHPSNIFAGAAIAAAIAAKAKAGRWWKQPGRLLTNPRFLVAAALVLGLAAAWIANTLQQPGAGGIVQRLTRPGRIIAERPLAATVVGLPRLLLGGTTYQFIAGSRSWLEWPYPTPGPLAVGIDTLLGWTVLGVAALVLWRGWRRDQRWEDRVLLGALALNLLAVVVLVGPRAFQPGWDRYALSLIVPCVLLVGRAIALVYSAADRAGAKGVSPKPGASGASPSRGDDATESATRPTRDKRQHIGEGQHTAEGHGRAVVLGCLAFAWLLVADFHAHYFRFIRRTGGEAHLTFRTGPTEPKLAAWQFILGRQPASVSGEAGLPQKPRKPANSPDTKPAPRPADQASRSPSFLVLTEEYWLYWPLRYLSLGADRGEVLPALDGISGMPDRMRGLDDLRHAARRGQLWWVDFHATPRRAPIEDNAGARSTSGAPGQPSAGRPPELTGEGSVKGHDHAEDEHRDPPHGSHPEALHPPRGWWFEAVDYSGRPVLRVR